MILTRFRRLIHGFLLLVLLAPVFLSACSPAGESLALAGGSAAAQATLVGAPADATPTPTPFRPIPPTAIFQPTGQPSPTPTPLPTAAPTPTVVVRNGSGRFSLRQPENQINILLLGSDRRPWDVGFRTDTIILATLNTELGTVNLTSFPRDLYLEIPGHGWNRINTAFYMGGVELLYQTLDYNFGIAPDHYVLVNFKSFKQAVDSLGGLNVKVGKELTDYHYSYGYITIPEGEVYMDADMVLWYVRSRKTTNDFERGRRQQEVLQALFDKMVSQNAIKRAPEFYDLYRENVTTDLTFPDLIGFVPLALKVAEDRSRLNHYFIGPQQTYDWITPDGGMVLMPQPDAIQQVLRQSLNIP